MVCILFASETWNADIVPNVDITTLRSQHHICGILTGTLPHLSQQNVFLGVPLILMPEEAVLLVENGINYNSPISHCCNSSAIPQS